MPTRPLPPNTCNGTVNLHVDAWRAFRRLAYMHSESAGARLRRLIAADLASARARGLELVRDARQMILPLAMLLVAACGLLAVGVASITGHNELRRPRIIRRVARRRDHPGVDIEGDAV